MIDMVKNNMSERIVNHRSSEVVSCKKKLFTCSTKILHPIYKEMSSILIGCAKLVDICQTKAGLVNKRILTVEA